MFEILPPSQPADPVTLVVAAKNAGVAALVAFGVLYATAYRRVGADNFVFVDWLVANRNRWVNLIVTLIIFSGISLLIPDVSSISNQIGFNLNATVPLSFGLALAAWCASVTKAAEPKVADQGDPKKD